MTYDTFQRPLKDLRISVTDRCNFRCFYCMPAGVFGHDYIFLNRKEILSFEEVHRIARIFVGLGVTKIRLTGGEPLLRSDLEVLVRMLSQIEDLEDLALTTNAYLLDQKAEALSKAGLNRLTISLDTLKQERLKNFAGQHLQLDNVLEGIRAAQSCGFSPLKLNSVIRKGVNDDEILDLVRYAKANGHIIRFIEFMDVGTLNSWKMNEVVPAKEAIEIITSEFPIKPKEKNNPNEVASRYRFLDGSGELGFISSVTRPFCTDCSRARLSADGKIYTCLFASQGVDIKSMLRSGASDKQIQEKIVSIWKNRRDRYSQERAANMPAANEKKVEMYQIGG